LTEIDKQVVFKLFELSINRYSEVRRQAQSYLFTILSRFFFSYQIILDYIIELLNKFNEVDHDQIKGCLYIILGNDSFFLPTKHSWIILEKLWPSIASTKHAMKLSTQNLINCIMEKMCKRFNTIAIIEETNEISRKAAVDLWRSLEKHDNQIREERNQANIQSYNNLMEKLTSLFSNNPL
jgi:proteasome activator subunit 4